MLLRQIKFFVLVVDENSFTQAAEKDFVSHPAIMPGLSVYPKKKSLSEQEALLHRIYLIMLLQSAILQG